MYKKILIGLSMGIFLSACSGMLTKWSEMEGLRPDTDKSKLVEVFTDESKVGNCKYLGMVETDVKVGFIREPTVADVYKNLRIRTAELGGDAVVVLGNVVSQERMKGRMSGAGKAYKCKH